MKLGGYLDGSDVIDVKDEDLIKIGESQVHKNKGQHTVAHSFPKVIP